MPEQNVLVEQIGKSIAGQEPSWKNALSRKALKILSKRPDSNQTQGAKEAFQKSKQEYETKLRDGVKERLGQEALEQMTNTTEQIGHALFIRLLELSESGGDAQAFLESTRNFSNYLFARVSSENLTPEAADVAIKGATALLSPEPLQSYKADAHALSEALQKRY